ncbi:hypothetical protein DE146DRAFT_143144 [Phaeosphaeria sp. MPI-PUGE-AT-0046c]|nr:hypothetical protein DE146DRAFT_143144 [Phaeosphaeria sp. MPI-PUGE-AT-0046c]
MRRSGASVVSVKWQARLIGEVALLMQIFLFVAASPHLPTACLAGKAKVCELFFLFFQPSVDAPDCLVLVCVCIDGVADICTETCACVSHARRLPRSFDNQIGATYVGRTQRYFKGTCGYLCNLLRAACLLWPWISGNGSKSGHRG